MGINGDIITDWWFQPTPLKNDGVSQLGILFPLYGKIKAMFRTTNQILSVNVFFGISTYLRHWNDDRPRICTRAGYGINGMMFPLKCWLPSGKLT